MLHFSLDFLTFYCGKKREKKRKKFWKMPLAKKNPNGEFEWDELTFVMHS